MKDKSISYDRLIQMVNESKKDIANIPYGFLCSEATAILLKKQFEQHINQEIQSLISVLGLEMLVVEFFSDECIWVLDEEDFKDVKKNGLASLIRKIARRNNMKLWEPTMGKKVRVTSKKIKVDVDLNYWGIPNSFIFFKRKEGLVDIKNSTS